MEDRVKKALIGAKEEIQMLRDINKIYAARQQMFDDCMSLVNCRPRETRNGCSFPDAIYEIESLLKDSEVEKVVCQPDPKPYDGPCGPGPIKGESVVAGPQMSGPEPFKNNHDDIVDQIAHQMTAC